MFFFIKQCDPNFLIKLTEMFYFIVIAIRKAKRKDYINKSFFLISIIPFLEVIKL